MMIDEDATQAERSRSLKQEMRQVFTDWVSKLPFMKRESPQHSGGDSLEEKPTDQPPGFHSADGTLSGGSQDKKERDR